jgi:hypothetical protein
MPYQITLPDGSIGMIDDSVPRNRAMEAAEAAYPDAFPGIGEQLLGAPAELAKGFARGFVDPVSGLLSTGYTGLRAAGVEMDPFAETAVGKGLAEIQESLAPGYGTISQFTGAVGGLGSFLVPGVALAKGVGRAATLGGMATGLGAEEARGRVEEARAEGIEVTPGQEFTSQLGGTAIGLTELAPIERLTGPLQAVLRGVKKSDADMIAPGLFNSAKRMVETGGIEGLQEGMANVAQDLLAKGIYNPNLEVGDSALGDAAMGASVGAFAQGAIELVTRGRRKSLYESLKTEEEQKTRDAEAEKARLAKETARKQTLTNFGVEGQPLLLAAPQGQVTPSRQEKSSLDQYGVEDKDLFEPYGTFTRDELDKDVVKELDKRRDEAGRPKTETFTLQDIADTGVYRGELNRLIAQRSGYTGETKFKPSEVVGLAEQKNIDTSTQGFSDFVGRVTGKKPLPEKTGLGALQGLNDVEIFAVREAINKLPTYEQRKILPAGKAAKIFDDKQATRTLTNIKKTLGQDLGEKGLGETSVLKEIGDFSGLKDVNDQQSLLEKYIADGELERVSTPAVAVLDANGKQVSVVEGSTQAERVQAQKKAQEIGGTIKDTSINQIRTPDPVNRLIGGFDIRQGTFEDTLIDGYDITTETGEVIGKTKSLTDAENRVNRATELRKQRQLQLLDAKQKIQENIAKSEQAMADLEALGKKDSEDFKKIQNSMAAQERNLAKVEQNLIEFGKKVAFKSRYKQQKRTGFTLFEGNKPVGTYNSRQEALEASVVSQPTDRLEAMLEAFPTLSASAKPGMDRADIKKLQQVAASELASRKGEIPSGVGITVEGDITAAEERLALQGIFSPRIKERVNELDKKLRAALDKLGLKDVRLNIVAALRSPVGSADGIYAARLIKIALDAENPMRALRHEGIHALKELGAFTPDQWRVLENKAKSEWMAKYNIAGRYGDLNLDQASMLEEAISDAFSDFSQTKPPAGLIGNVFSRIKSFFAALDNGFKGLGFQTADDVFGRVERGELLPGMGERAAEVQGLQAQRVVAETPERYALKTVQDVIDDGINRLVKSVLQPSVPSGFKSLVNDRVSFRKVDANLEKIEDGIMNRLQGFGMTNSEAFNILYNDIRYVADQKFQEIREQEYQARRAAVQPQERYQLRDDKKGPRILKNGQIVGAPPDARTVRQRTGLVTRMTNLLDSPFTLLNESKNWYEDSGAAIREITRGDPELTERVVRLMALYSQANGVGGNTTATIRSIYQLATDSAFLMDTRQPTAFAGRFPNTTAERIPAILAAPTMDDSIPGVDDKLMNFYRNLYDATYQTNTFDEASTIDRWMMRLFGYPHSEDQDVGGATGLSKTQYDYAKDIVRRIGDTHFDRTGERLLPRQIQAALWTYVKNKTDYDSLSKEKQKTFVPSIIDFSDYITRATANITWETRPSTSVDFLPGIHQAPRNQKENFNKAVRSIFEDENGNDLIFQLLGGEQLYSSQFSIGAYENQIAPNVITRLVLRKDDKEYITDAANKYASIVGYVTKQDAVPWYRADPTAGGKLASVGYRVTASIENVDADFEQRLFDHLNDVIPGIGFTRINNSFDFVNFRGNDGKPSFLPDKKYKTDLLNALEFFPEDIKFNIEPFRAESAYISNNWKENTNGEGYLTAFSPGELANIRDTIDGWRSAYEQIGRDYAQEFGWDRRDGGRRDQGRSLAPLEGAPVIQGATGPDPRLVDVAEAYAQANNIPYTRQGEYVEINPEFAESLAAAYEAMPHDPKNKKVKEAFADLAKQVRQQYDALVNAGYQFTFFDSTNDPYDGNPWNAMRDLRTNKRMAVYGTYDGYGTEGITGAAIENNPMLQDTGLRWPDQEGVTHPVTVNDLFRAVHDAFGHGLEGAGFRARGEENAFQAHARLFTGPALGALATETRGQNSWMNFGPHAEKNKTAKVEDSVFAEQKTGLLPEWAWKQNIAPAQKYSLRTANTPEFKQWFGQSQIVDEQGRPRVMYHGTARDITEFKPKQAGAIFVTEDPRFAEDFSYMSEVWMIDHATQFLSEQEIKKAVAAGVMKMAQGMPKQKQIQMLTEILQFPIDSVVRDPDATEIRNEIAKRLPSKPNILPVYVRAENPFDFENQGHLEAIRSMPGVPVHYQRIRRGEWSAIEEPDVQEAIQKAGFDSFYITEGGRKNLAVYDPNQLKSVTGNIGTYGQREPTINEAKQFGLTVEEAKAAQKRGDIRYSLRNTNTPEFKQWFRKSPIVDAVGKPQMMFHGTSLDIEEFIPGQTGAIYVSPDPEFAGTFAKYSQEREIRKLGENLDQDPEAKRRILDPIIDEAMANGDLTNRDLPYHRDLAQVGLIKDLDQYSKEYWMNWFLEKPMRDAAHSTGVGPALREALANMLTTGRNVMPLYVNPQKPFDYENNTHVNKVAKLVFEYDPDTYESANPKVQKYQRDTLIDGLKAGDWRVLEEPIVQEAIKELGFDAFYVKEQDTKNLGLYKPNQLKSAIGNTGAFSPETGKVRYSLRQQAGQTLGQSYLDTVQRTTTPRVEKGFKDRISEAMSATPFAKFRQMFINKYERIEYFSKQLAKQFGDAVLLADQSAIAAALMSDRAAGVAAESFKSGIPVYAKGYTYVDNMGGKVKGLMEILMPLAQKQDPFVYQMYQDYAARRRGVRLDSEGKITPFTRQELSEIPKIEKAFPEFKQVFEDYQRYNEGLVRYMRDTGVIDAKAAQEWMRYGDYVPFYRQLEGESTVGPSIFSAISGVKAPKKLKGGDAPLGEFLETVVRNSRAAIEAGMRNVAANRVVNNFQSLNSPSTGGRLVEKTSEQNKNRPDVVTVRENGKDAYYKVADPLLVQSLQALNIPQIPGLDILAKPAEFLREMVTRDPAFIGASVLRESLSAWITTGQKLTPVASGVNQFVKILANASPTVQALRRAGIGSGYEFKGDVQATAGEFGRSAKEMAGEMTAAQKAVMPLRAMWDGLDKASTAADLSTRAAVFERVMQETGNEAEAIYQAMEVINFSRKGSSPIIQIFAAIIPFLNARIQGLDLLYRAGFGELASATKVAQQKAFMLRSLALFGTTAMYYALVQDEEEWQRADQETRDNYWIIGNMKFPIPFELGVIFKVMPERIMAYTMGEDTGQQVLNSIGRNIAGTLSFNPIPQAVLPLVEASSNYSFFLGRDIVGMGKKDLAPEFQTSEGTSQIAIQLGQTLGLSPMKIDYVIRGYTGAMGTYAITAMDSIIRSEDDATKATWRLDQIPVLKRFMISDLGAGTVNEYYDLREKLDEVVRTSNQLERTGNIEALQEYLKDNGQVLGIKDYIRSLDKDMKSLRESRMAINMSRMEPDQKREALDSLRRAEISLTERIGLLRSNLGV